MVFLPDKSTRHTTPLTQLTALATRRIKVIGSELYLIPYYTTDQLFSSGKGLVVRASYGKLNCEYRTVYMASQMLNK